jgi:adenylate kinase family enzyme
MPHPVLILTGPPGAGKSTVASLLAGRTDLGVHLESDLFFHFVRAGHVEPWKAEAQEQNTAVMGIVAVAATGYADAGYFTVIDGIISPRWFLEPLRETLRAAGHTVAYAVLRAPLEVCTARAVSREARALADTAVIEQLWREFAELGALETHVLDSNENSAMAIAPEIMRRLAEGALDV